jgi:glycosyltransferase involved in cell wall biosynthesis
VFEEGRIETLVVDSNSPDKTRAIAQRYANKVVNMKDRGVSKARNLGAQKATSELLVFVDADTILDPRFLAGIHEALNHSSAVYVVGTMAGLEWYGTADNLFKFLHYGLVNLISTLTAHLGFPFFPTVCCACKKSAFKRVGGFDEDLAIAEDLKFSLKMGKIGKCLVSRKAKAYTSLRRIRKNGVMKNSYMYFSNYFKVFVLNKKPWITDFPHTSETQDNRLIS